MPWFNEIDDTRPTDLEFVSEGAERFRELKRALIERLGTAFIGFPDENPDRPGEALLFPIASVQVGTEAQRPGVAEREGSAFIATDSGRIWYTDRNLQWKVVPATDPGAAGPGEASLGSRVLVSGWEHNLGAGNKIFSTDVAVDIVQLSGFFGPTSSTGIVLIDFDEFGRHVDDLLQHGVMFSPIRSEDLYYIGVPASPSVDFANNRYRVQVLNHNNVPYNAGNGFVRVSFPFATSLEEDYDYDE